MIFKDRREAGEKLAEALKKYQNAPQTIILALPRGGVVAAEPIAKELHLPLDVIIPRKIGAPGHEELAIGAITEDGKGFFDQQIIEAYNIPKSYLEKTVVKEKAEILRRLKLYRGHRPPLNLLGQTVILIDDGLATGLTMRAAIASARKKGATRIVVAVPVAAEDSASLIKREADEFVCLFIPPFFGAVGAFYENFEQTTDEEVINILKNTAS